MFWCQGQIPDDDTGGIGHGRPDGRLDREQTALADALGAIGTGPILVLDRDALHVQRQVHRGRDAVVDGTEVPDAARLVEDDVLHQRVAQALDGRAFVLASDLLRVQGLAGVAHDDVLVDGDVARLLIDRRAPPRCN